MTNIINEKSKPDYSLTIPSDVIEQIGLAKAEAGEVHIFDHSLLLLKGELTAPELISTCESLREFAGELMVKLASACGLCKNCKVCPIDSEDEGSLLFGLPDSVLEVFRNAGVCLLELEGLLESEDALDGE